MSRHKFEIVVTVDDNLLADHNLGAATTGRGLPIPDDPSEWNENDLAVATNEEIAEIEVTGYWTVDK